MGSESDDSDLRERIAELETTVEQQQQTIKRMLPGRRSALKAGGLLAGGGLLGAAGSDQAAAADGTQDTSDGTVRGNGGGVDIRLDELRDPGGDEVFDIDDTGAINAAVSGREFRFDSISTEKGRVRTLRNVDHWVDAASEKAYSTLSDAFSVASEGDTIFISSDTEEPNPLTPPDGLTVVGPTAALGQKDNLLPGVRVKPKNADVFINAQKGLYIDGFTLDCDSTATVGVDVGDADNMVHIGQTAQIRGATTAGLRVDSGYHVWVGGHLSESQTNLLIKQTGNTRTSNISVLPTSHIVSATGNNVEIYGGESIGINPMILTAAGNHGLLADPTDSTILGMAVGGGIDTHIENNTGDGIHLQSTTTGNLMEIIALGNLILRGNDTSINISSASSFGNVQRISLMNIRQNGPVGTSALTIGSNVNSVKRYNCFFSGPVSANPAALDDHDAFPTRNSDIVDYSGANKLDIPQYSDSATAPSGTLFYNQNAAAVEYKP